jgi:hypothetical protein
MSGTEPTFEHWDPIILHGRRSSQIPQASRGMSRAGYQGDRPIGHGNCSRQSHVVNQFGTVRQCPANIGLRSLFVIVAKRTALPCFRRRISSHGTYRSRPFQKALGLSCPNMALTFTALLATVLRSCRRPPELAASFSMAGVAVSLLGRPSSVLAPFHSLYRE